jgi:hypothetical protein
LFVLLREISWDFVDRVIKIRSHTIHETTRSYTIRAQTASEPDQFIVSRSIHLVSVIKLRKDNQQDAKKGSYANTYSQGQVLGL